MTEDIQISNLYRQEIMLKLAISNLSQYSEKYSAMIQLIDQLIILTNYKPTEKEQKILTYCREQVGKCEAYSAHIKTKTEDVEDTKNKTFLKYRKAETRLYQFYPTLKKLEINLISQTNLKYQTIPHSHWNLARKSSKRYYEEEAEGKVPSEEQEDEIDLGEDEE